MVCFRGWKRTVLLSLKSWRIIQRWAYSYTDEKHSSWNAGINSGILHTVNIPLTLETYTKTEYTKIVVRSPTHWLHSTLNCRKSITVALLRRKNTVNENHANTRLVQLAPQYHLGARVEKKDSFILSGFSDDHKQQKNNNPQSVFPAKRHARHSLTVVQKHRTHLSL